MASVSETSSYDGARTPRPRDPPVRSRDVEFPSYPWRAAHLCALWAYGVAQPVFSMLSANPEFLVVRGSTRWDVAAFVLILTLAPPLAVVALEGLLSRVPGGLSRATHVVATGCFTYLAVLQLVRLIGPERGAALLLPLVPAALVALAYPTWRGVRTFLSISLALPVVGSLAFVSMAPLAADDRAGAEVAVSTETPVVLVVFDEFPLSSILEEDGSLDERRYPNFARLARDGVWYPRAASVHGGTTQAVPAILTGRRTRPGELPTVRDHPENLFTLLGEEYDIRAFEQVTRLCPARYCPRTRAQVSLVDRQRGLLYDVSVGYLHRVLPGSIRAGLPPIGERWGGFGEARSADARELVLGALDKNAWNGAFAQARNHRRAQFEDFLRSLQAPRERRTLYFEHALLPHTPWAFLPSGREYGSAATLEGIDDDWSRWRPSRLLVDQALQRHLLQVGYTDRLLGVLIRRLEGAGDYDRALIVVTADHGASFQPGGYMRRLEEGSLADIASVPLFVKYPGGRQGRVDRRDARTVDIVPTIADVVGVRIPWRVDGSSLLERPVARRVSVAVSTGESFTEASDAVEARVRATAVRNASLFGNGDDSRYRLGPYTSLLGRPVRLMRISQMRRAEIELVDAELFEAVRPASAFVPTRIVGRIYGDLPIGSAMAVAVNGRVAATTTSYGARGSRRFAVLVPESSFRAGRNTVDIYAVQSRSGPVRLDWLGGTSGRPISVRASRRTGSVRESKLGSRASMLHRAARTTTAISSSR